MSGAGAVRRRWAAARRATAMARAVARDLTPPDQADYGAFGTNTWVVAPARVTTPSRIFLGDDVTILEHAFLSVVAAVPGTVPTLRIGDGTRIGRFAHIACVGDIEIGPQVLTSERVFIGDTYHGYEDPTRPVIAQPMAPPLPVRIERGAFLGIGAVVLMGVTVGEHAYVAAGAVVTDDVPPRTLVVGNPARPVRRWDEPSASWVAV
jgi:acetyltransferase-like isoleucine patch superfamily enzyme